MNGLSKDVARYNLIPLLEPESASALASTNGVFRRLVNGVKTRAANIKNGSERAHFRRKQRRLAYGLTWYSLVIAQLLPFALLWLVTALTALRFDGWPCPPWLEHSLAIAFAIALILIYSDLCVLFKLKAACTSARKSWCQRSPWEQQLKFSTVVGLFSRYFNDRALFLTMLLHHAWQLLCSLMLLFYVDYYSYRWLWMAPFVVANPLFSGRRTFAMLNAPKKKFAEMLMHYSFVQLNILGTAGLSSIRTDDNIERAYGRFATSHRLQDIAWLQAMSWFVVTELVACTVGVFANETLNCENPYSMWNRAPKVARRNTRWMVAHAFAVFCVLSCLHPTAFDRTLSSNYHKNDTYACNMATVETNNVQYKARLVGAAPIGNNITWIATNVKSVKSHDHAFHTVWSYEQQAAQGQTICSLAFHVQQDGGSAFIVSGIPNLYAQIKKHEWPFHNAKLCRNQQQQHCWEYIWHAQTQTCSFREVNVNQTQQTDLHIPIVLVQDTLTLTLANSTHQEVVKVTPTFAFQRWASHLVAFLPCLAFQLLTFLAMIKSSHNEFRRNVRKIERVFRDDNKQD